MTIQGAVLDNDGTLTLSNDAHAHAWVDAFAEQGYDVRETCHAIGLRTSALRSS